jgi:H+-transporting ATPase
MTTVAVRQRPRLAESAVAAKDEQPSGLTDEEAHSRLAKFGPNAMPDTSLHPLRMALEKFWAPVPWMLEAAIVLEVALGKYVEAAIVAGLLVLNAALGLFQGSRTQATLAALKSRLAPTPPSGAMAGGRPCKRPSWCRAT